MDAADIIEIHQLMALYGHAVDHVDQSLFEQVFAEDAVFDTRAVGGPLAEGLDAIVALNVAAKPSNPPSHNMSNPYVHEADGEVRVLSKWFMLSRASGSLVLGTYEDVVVRTDRGWRIRRRVARLAHPRPPGAA